MSEKTDEQKKTLADADLKQQISLAKSDKSYRMLHPELEMYLTANLDDPAQRALIEKAIDAKKEAQKSREEKELSKEELAEQLEEERARRESAEATNLLIAEKELARKAKAMGADPAKINTPQLLEGFEAGLKASGKAPSGQAPLQSDYFEQINRNRDNTDIRHMPFNSQKEMVKFLHSPSATSEEAREKEKALDDLWKHGMELWKSQGDKRSEQNYNPNNEVPSTGVKEPTITATENVKEDSAESELEKFRIKRKKRGPFLSGQPQPSPQVKQKESD